MSNEMRADFDIDGGALSGGDRSILPVGYVLADGQYEIKKVLGRGGFGITYEALDRNLHRSVAIKEFFPHHCAYRDTRNYTVMIPQKSQKSYERSLIRFEQEGQILARLNHRSIVKVYSLFRELNTVYLVMELLDGHSLGDELEARNNVPISSRLVQKIGNALVDALSVTHQANIYHLDIKPDNIMLTTDGRIILLDFGAARWQDGEDEKGRPRSIAAYTPEYAPLELIRGEPVGPETDIFELGVLFYELLTGKRPPDVLLRLGEEKHWVPDVEMPWFQLISEALVLERSQRPHCVREWWYRSFSTQISSATRPATTNTFLDGLMHLYGNVRYSYVRYKYSLLAGVVFGVLFLFGGIFWVVFSQNNLGLRRYWAEQALVKGNLHEALKHYNRALQLSPQDSTLYESRADVRNQLKDFEGAILDYREALRLNPSSPVELQSKLARAYINLGDHHQYLNNFTEAIVNYKQAVSVSSIIKPIALDRINEARLGEANLKLKSEEFLDAIKLHEEILSEENLSSSFRDKVNLSLGNVLYLYGERLLKDGQLEKAVRSFDLAINQGNNSPNVYVSRGITLAQLGQLDKALKDLDQAIYLDDKASGYYAVRGQIKATMGNQLGAIADFNQSIKLGNENFVVYLQRGKSYMKIQNYKAAVEDFNQVLLNEENNEEALLQRGWSLYFMKNYPQAIVDFNEVIRINPERAEAYEGSGYVKIFLKDKRGSLIDLNKAVELYTKNNDLNSVERINNWRQENAKLYEKKA